MSDPVLPGAQFAPIVTRTRRGLRAATEDEAQALERREAYSIYGVLTAIENGQEIAVWRLSCADADDQRAIWRRVALLYGASEDQAMHSRIEFTRIGLLSVLVWRLSIPSRWFVEGAATTWGDYEAATAALCARVWGPHV